MDGGAPEGPKAVVRGVPDRMSQTSLRVGPNRVRWHDADGETRERFEEIKDRLREREPFEVTNAYVLNLLCDVYWLHAEDGEGEP